MRARAADRLCRRKNNEGIRSCSTVDALRSTHIPVLLIHGTDDSFVPVSMTYENYKACAGPKELLVVPGADHGMSYFVDRRRYEETLKAFGKKKLDNKILLMGMKYEKKDFPKMYGLLFSVGVNSLVWNNGTEETEVELTSIVRQPDLSKLEPEKRPLINSTLQLSGIYFMQELRRPVAKEEHGNLRELEEELIANLRKAEFLVAMAPSEEDPAKVNIPYLKNKEGKILQPVFSDVMEYEKFAKGKKMRIAKLPFAKLPEIMIPQAEAMVINPLGFNLLLNKEQLKKIIG